MARQRTWFYYLQLGEYIIPLALFGIYALVAVLASALGASIESALGILLIAVTGVPYGFAIVWAMDRWILWSEGYIIRREIVVQEPEPESAPSSKLRIVVVVVIFLLAARKLAQKKI